MFDKLLTFIKKYFLNVESGLQGDGWIWVINGSEKVSLDTFTSMRFQIKSSQNSREFVEKVIEVVRKKYSVRVYVRPELEIHE